MKASPVAISLLSFVSSALADCQFDRGLSPGWGDRQRALQAVKEACQQVRQGEGLTALAGTYEPGSNKVSNEKITDNLEYTFAIRWWGEQSTFLSESQCIEYLQSEVQSCEFGGVSYYGGVEAWRVLAAASNGSLFS
ncbi:hypothetical protein ACKAV7_014716 [Fusarium commune]